MKQFPRYQRIEVSLVSMTTLIYWQVYVHIIVHMAVSSKFKHSIYFEKVSKRNKTWEN